MRLTAKMKDSNRLYQAPAKLGVSGTNNWKGGERNSSSVPDRWRTVLGCGCFHRRKLIMKAICNNTAAIYAERFVSF